ncbi:MAG: hypothetical protein ACI8T1_000299 [Verrucomicrobiales bacterium]|jgi:hypothetical protein
MARCFFDQGIPNAHVISPQQPAASLERLRVAVVGEAQMPPVGRNQVDLAAVDVITAWINAIDPVFASLIARDDQEVAPFASSVTISPLSNDDGEALVIASIVTDPSHGQVSVANDALTLICAPNAGHVGADSFTYQARQTDGGLTNLATITIITAAALVSQDIHFTDQSAWLPAPASTSGVAMAVVDMNADGRDDQVHFDDARTLMIDYQTAQEGVFSHTSLGSFCEKNLWILAIADVDHNGGNDVLFGGYFDSLHLLKASGAGSFEASMIPNSEVF